MLQRKLECVEIIEMKDPIQKVESCGDKILVITQSRGLKVKVSLFWLLVKYMLGTAGFRLCNQ